MHVLAGLAILGVVVPAAAEPGHAGQEVAAEAPGPPAPAPRTAARSPSDTVAAIHGQVRSDHTGRPLPHVFVQAAAGPARFTALTDRQGRYALEGVGAGRWTVRAYALDHAPLEVDVVVPGSRPVEVDLTLPLRPVGLDPIVARVLGVPRPAVGSGGGSPAAAAAPEARDAELRALEATPGMAELGLADAARGGTGPDPVDPSSILYVRGAASDLKLVLLDGAPVYAPFHLGGLMESFHPDVLESSRLFLGGAPSRYDGGLSYVLDLRSRSGDDERLGAGGAVDLLSFRQRVEGPLGPATVLASGRAIHGSALHETLTGTPLPYGYGDALARVDLPVGQGGDVSATFFWNGESVRLDSASLDGGPARWGNTAGSLRYAGALEGGRIDLTAAVGLFRTRLPLGGDTVRIAAGESRRVRFGLDYARDVYPDLSVGAGISYDRTDLEHQAGEPGHLLQPIGGGKGESAGIYGETLWSPSRQVDLRAGLRTDMFFTAREIRLAPRVSATWHVSEDASLSLAAGRFHQYVRAPETILGGDLDGLTPEELRELADAAEDVPSSIDLTAATLGVAGASHVVLGLENDLREGLRLGLEGFLKDFDEIPGAPDNLRASGVDLWIHQATGTLVGWVGYSLAFVWTDDVPHRETRRFAGRHLLTAGLRSRLRNGIVLEARLAYGAGLPFTSIPVTRGGSPEFQARPGGLGGPAMLVAGGAGPAVGSGEPGEEGAAGRPSPEDDPPLAGAPPGSYLRLDGKISRPWLARLGEVDVELVPYVKVLNALDRRDALFFQFDPDRDVAPRSLSAVPLLPVVGIEWKL